MHWMHLRPPDEPTASLESTAPAPLKSSGASYCTRLVVRCLRCIPFAILAHGLWQLYELRQFVKSGEILMKSILSLTRPPPSLMFAMRRTTLKLNHMSDKLPIRYAGNTPMQLISWLTPRLSSCLRPPAFQSLHPLSLESQCPLTNTSKFYNVQTSLHGSLQACRSLRPTFHLLPPLALPPPITTSGSVHTHRASMYSNTGSIFSKASNLKYPSYHGDET